MEVNPTLLSNRIACVPNNSSDMGTLFAYELAPQPPSLFHGGATGSQQRVLWDCSQNHSPNKPTCQRMASSS